MCAAIRIGDSLTNLRLMHYYPRAWVGDGGCTFAVRGWASALAEKGAQVTVVCDGSGEAPQTTDVRYIATSHRGSGNLRAAVGLERILKGQDLLVLHSAWAYHNVQAARSAVRTQVPYLLTPHGAYDPNVFRRRRTAKWIWWGLFERELVARARGIHVFFQDQADELRERLGYKGCIIVAPNGLAIPDLASRTTRSDYLLWMGRFDIETKGLDLLLRALAALHRNERPQARLHGPDWRGGKQQTEQLVQELGLTDYVTIGPPLYGSAKWDALRDCGLFIFPSRWEGQGLMALEAAAAGAPLVVTNTTSLGRHLAWAQAAIIVEPTPQHIAAGIVRGRSLSGAGELGARASQLVRQRFSWPAVAEDYASQLRSLLTESGANSQLAPQHS
jgi:glycosyltransferase involved in cell wall biosynthesis